MNIEQLMTELFGICFFLFALTSPAHALDTFPVPEPATILLLGAGLFGGGMLMRKWRKK